MSRTGVFQEEEKTLLQLDTEGKKNSSVWSKKAAIC